MKYALLLTTIWVVYIVINIVLAQWNNELRKKNITIHHGWWGLMYAGICGVAFLFFKDWWYEGALALLHLSIFPVAFNIGDDVPAFHLSATTTAITDDIMRRLGFKSTELVNFLALAGSIALLILSIKS